MVYNCLYIDAFKQGLTTTSCNPCNFVIYQYIILYTVLKKICSLIIVKIFLINIWKPKQY